MRKVIFILLAVVFAEPVYSSCDAQDMDVFGFTPSVVDFNTGTQFTVSYSVSHDPIQWWELDCYFFGTMGYGGASTWTNRNLRHVTGADTIPYNVYSQSNYANGSILRTSSDASQNKHVLYDGTRFRTSSTTVTVAQEFFTSLGTVPTNLEPGLYTDSLVFYLAADTSRLRGNYANWDVVANRAIQFIYRVPKELDLAIVASGGVFDLGATAMLMSFGELETSEVRAASVIVKTNVGYRLSVSSKNEGFMSHESLSAQVPYILRVNGSTVSLAGSQSSPVQVSSSASNSPPEGFSIPMEVQIGSMTGTEPGGEYSDVVYFSIEAY